MKDSRPSRVSLLVGWLLLLWTWPMVVHAADPLTRLDPERYGPGTIMVAIEQLAGYTPSQAVEPVRALLGHEDVALVRTAAWFLRRAGRGDEGVASAQAVLQDPQASEKSRLSAATAIGVLRSAAGATVAAQALTGDESALVRRAAVLALGRLHRAGWTVPLIAAAGVDEDERVRVACVRALGMLPDTTAEQLFELLVSAEPAAARREAAWALGQGRFAAVAGLAGQLTRALQSDPDCRVRAAAAWALGQQGDPSTRPALEAAAAGSSGCRLAAQAATVALGRLE